MKRKPYIIEWRDACRTPNEPHPVIMIRSIGYLMKKNKQRVVLMRDDDYMGGREFLTIPAELVTRMKRLR